MDTTLMLIIELLGGVTLLFAVGWLFARATGYDRYYDRMLYGDNNTYLTIENNNNNGDDIIHHLYF